MKKYRREQLKKYLNKKVKKGFTGYPLATIALYGPNDQVVTKISVGILLADDRDPEFMQKWYSQEDLRSDEGSMLEIIQYIKMHQIRSIVMLEKIIGCPHEEGKDYADGESCPQCPYWKNRNRWTGELSH